MILVSVSVRVKLADGLPKWIGDEWHNKLHSHNCFDAVFAQFVILLLNIVMMTMMMMTMMTRWLRQLVKPGVLSLATSLESVNSGFVYRQDISPVSRFQQHDS